MTVPSLATAGAAPLLLPAFPGIASVHTAGEGAEAFAPVLSALLTPHASKPAEPVSPVQSVLTPAITFVDFASERAPSGAVLAPMQDAFVATASSKASALGAAIDQASGRTAGGMMLPAGAPPLPRTGKPTPPAGLAAAADPAPQPPNPAPGTPYDAQPRLEERTPLAGVAVAASSNDTQMAPAADAPRQSSAFPVAPEQGAMTSMPAIVRHPAHTARPSRFVTAPGPSPVRNAADPMASCAAASPLDPSSPAPSPADAGLPVVATPADASATGAASPALDAAVVPPATVATAMPASVVATLPPVVPATPVADMAVATVAMRSPEASPRRYASGGERAENAKTVIQPSGANPAAVVASSPPLQDTLRGQPAQALPSVAAPAPTSGGERVGTSGLPLTPLAGPVPIPRGAAPPPEVLAPPLAPATVPIGSSAAPAAVVQSRNAAPSDSNAAAIGSPASAANPAMAPAPAAASRKAIAATILPAFRAFGAALHRIAAAERQPPSPDPMAASLAPVIASTAPAAAAPAPAPLDVTRPGWPDAMVARIEQIRELQEAPGTAADTRIRLHPDALGSIDVTLRQEVGGVRIQLTATEPATRALLADAQPRLQELADARGLKLAGSNVDAGSQGFSGERRQPTPARTTPNTARPVAEAPDIDTEIRIA